MNTLWNFVLHAPLPALCMNMKVQASAAFGIFEWRSRCCCRSPWSSTMMCLWRKISRLRPMRHTCTESAAAGGFGRKGAAFNLVSGTKVSPLGITWPVHHSSFADN